MTTSLPFRWDLARRQQLGRLLDGPVAESYRGLIDDLRDCCVRVLAQARGSDLAFVGRSPESIYDYLTGVLAGTAHAERCVLLNLSMRHETADEVERTAPANLRALRQQLEHIGLGPAQIAASERPWTFVDLVCGGNTFGNLAGLLAHFAAAEGVDARAVRRRIGFIGIVVRGKNSPNTWRWYQKVPWARDFPRSALRSVSVDAWTWQYLGEYQKKVARWHPPMWWGEEWMAEPPHGESSLQALRLAVRIHQAGRHPAERARFAAALAARPEMKHAWLRRIVHDLRAHPARER